MVEIVHRAALLKISGRQIWLVTQMGVWSGLLAASVIVLYPPLLVLALSPCQGLIMNYYTISACTFVVFLEGGQVFTLKVAFSMSSPRSAGQFSPDEGSTSSPTVLTPRVSVAAATTTQAPVSVTITTAGSVSSGSSGSTGTMPSPRQDTDTDSGSQQKQQQVMPESILNGISNIQFSEQVSV